MTLGLNELQIMYRKFYLLTSNKIKSGILFRLIRVNECYSIILMGNGFLKPADNQASSVEFKKKILGIYRDNLLPPPGIWRTLDHKKYNNNYNLYIQRKLFKSDLFDKYRNRRLRKENDQVGKISWIKRYGMLPKQLLYNPLSFDCHWALMNRYLGIPLLDEMYINKTPYNPNQPNENNFIGERRLDILMRLGPLIGFFSSHYFGFINQWYDGILAVRKKRGDLDPEDFVENDVQNPQEENDRHFFNSIFPTSFWHGLKNHPRLYPVNGNTVSALKRPLKEEILGRVKSFTGLSFYELDITACHWEVFIQTEGKERVVENQLNKLPIRNESYWDFLTARFIKDTNLLQLVPVIPFRKAIKRSILSVLNGAEIGKSEHLIEFLQGQTDSLGNSLLIYTQLLSTWLDSLEICKLIKKVTNNWIRNGYIYPFGREHTYADQDNPYKILTAIYCSVEVQAISYIVQYLTTCTPEIFPVAIEGDGLLIASKYPLSRSSMAAISRSLETLVLSTVGMKFSITIEYI